MYQLNDTIVAVSSPTSEQRAIVRISGPGTIEVLQQIFDSSIPTCCLDLPAAPTRVGRRGGKRRETQRQEGGSTVMAGQVAVDPELAVDTELYLFLAPHSYTGDDVAEIHIYASPSVIETLIGGLLSKGLRMAGPGEFTARAYLNGKMDLTQAEAVNEIIVSSNKFQLAASEKLLAGRLAETTARVRADIMDCLSLIEAGLDFSGEDIEFVTCDEAVERLTQTKNELERLLSGRCRAEEIVDLPSAGIAGAPNAGKSSLLNKLLGEPRSIVSEYRKTTRDVLTGLLTLKHCRCVLFDCAGLIKSPTNILDELAQQAAAEALRNSSVVVFCVDISKDHWAEDLSIRQLVELEVLIAVATKCDLLEENVLAERLCLLNRLFDTDFLATSAKTGKGVALLRETIDRKIIELAVGGAKPKARYEIRDTKYEIALTARHRQAVVEAIESVGESINEVRAGNDEVAAMMLRAAYQAVSNIEQHNVDEEILERIFGRFCVGK